MMKKIFAAAAVSVMVLGTFTGCGDNADIGRDAALETALNDAGVNEADTTRLRVSEDRNNGRKTYDVQFNVDEKGYDYEIQASDGTILSSDIGTDVNYAAADQGNAGTSAADQGNAGTSAADQGNAGQSSADQNSTKQDGSGQSGTQTQDSASSQGSAQTQNNSQGSGSGTTQNNNSTAGNQGAYVGANVAISQDEAIQIALDRVQGATKQNILIKLDYDDGRYKYEGDIIYNYREYEFEIDANTGTILEWSEERI